MNVTLLLSIVALLCSHNSKVTLNTCSMTEVLYTFPEEGEPHEGTWLQWPHHYQYGKRYRNQLDPTWIALTRELVTSEKVHIVAYDKEEKIRIRNLLISKSIDLKQIDFWIYPTDDFWVRDNGPIYVRDSNGNIIIQDWGFNGWGNKADYQNCNDIPRRIGIDQGREVVNLNQVMNNEGGSIETDGNGTLIACKSSILNKNRNPGMNQQEAEEIFTRYLGVTNSSPLDQM